MKKSSLAVLAVALAMVVLGSALAVGAYFVSGGNIGVYYRNGRFESGQNGGFSGKMTDDRKEFSGARSIEIDADYARVELRSGAAGSAITVEYRYPLNQPKPVCAMNGDTLVFQSRQRNGNGAFFSLFNFNGFGFGNSGGSSDPYVYITYPAGSEFERAVVRSSLGDIVVNNLTVKGLLEIGADLGRVNVQDVTAGDFRSNVSSGSSEYSRVKAASIDLRSDLGSVTGDELDTEKFICKNSSGRISIQNSRLGEAILDADLGGIDADAITTTGLDVSNSSGSVKLEGALGGKSKVDVDLGSVKITTSLPRNQYYLDLSTDLGSVHVNGRKYGSTAVENEEAQPNSIVVSNSSGSVNVDFK